MNDDTRFRACARLLQSIWRQEQGLSPGVHQRGHTSKPRKLGSLLSKEIAAQGRNFLVPAVAQLARRELLYREPGAFLEPVRLFRNMLSSMPLTLNMFAPLRFSPALATSVLRALLPELDISAVTSLQFEHAPRPSAGSCWPDRTALDAAATFTTGHGKRGFIGFEVKYSECMSASSSSLHRSYDDRARTSDLFLDPDAGALRRAPCQQLFREHILIQGAQAAGDWQHASFILIAPSNNDQVQRAAALYSAQLTDPSNGPVPFINIQLEQFIAALAEAGERNYAAALHDRYCDWSKIGHLMEEELRRLNHEWQPCPSRSDQPRILIESAA